MKNKGLFHKIIYFTIISGFSLILSGCGGGSIGQTGLLSTSDGVAFVMEQGWGSYKSGNYEGAARQFEAVLNNGATSAQKQEANIGLGYCIIKSKGIREASSYFSSAIDHPDAKVGMAGYYLSAGSKDNISKGIQLLESIGLSNVDKIYTSKYNTGITDGDAHALLGVLYYMSDRIPEARQQLNKAKDANQPSNLVSAQVVNTIVSELID